MTESRCFPLVISIIIMHCGLFSRTVSGQPSDPPTPTQYGPYGIPNFIILHAVTAGNVDYQKAPLAIKISKDAEAPLFYNMDNNHNAARNKVAHYCINADYGPVHVAGGMPSHDEGDAYYNLAYSGYLPKPQLRKTCTGATNCISYVFDGWNGNRCRDWINATAPDPDPLTMAPNVTVINLPIAGPPNVGDRLYLIHRHIWRIETITNPTNTFPCVDMMWKDGVSGVYEWSCALNYGKSSPRGSISTNALNVDSFGGTLYFPADQILR